MKKLAIFACVMVVGAGAAVASTVNIPFFSDAGFASWIGVQNVDTSAVTISVTYYKNGTEVDGGTALFAVDESLSWRPYTDAGTDEQNQQTAFNVQTNTTTLGGSSPLDSGSVTIEADGAIVGRFIQLDLGGGWAFGHNVEITP